MKARRMRLSNILHPCSEAGQSIIIVALVFTGLLAIAGLAVDGGILWYSKSQLDAHADAAALAGGAELTRPDPAREKAEQYLYLNQVISGTNGIEVAINFGRRRIDNDVIVVDLYKDQPLNLMSFLGFKTARLHSHAAVYATTWATQDAWSLFRGGCGRTGLRTETGSYTESAAGSFKVEYYWGFRWDLKGDEENHRSTPVIAMHPDVLNNTPIAYVGTNGGAPGVAGGVFAFNTVISDTLWYTELGTMVRSSPYFLDDPAVIANFSTPHTNIPAVIVAGHNGHEYALNALTGAIIWDTAGISDDGASGQKYRSSPTYSCGPITVGGYTGGVIFNATGAGNVYAYKATDGTVLWRSTPDPNASLASWVTTGDDPAAEARFRVTGEIYGTANFVQNDDFTAAGYPQGIVYVATHGNGTTGTDDSFIYAIDAATGEGIWQGQFASDNRNSSAIAKIDTDRDGTPDQWRVYANPPDEFLYAYNAITGDLLWKADTGAPNHRSDKAIYKNTVFGGNNEGFYALDAVCGYSIWDDTVVNDGDTVGGAVCTNSADQANPYYSIETNPGGSAFASGSLGTRLIPGGVKSAPAIADGIIMVGANKTSTGGAGGSMWALWWADGHVLNVRQPGDAPQAPDFAADDNDPPFDTDSYDGPGPYFGGTTDGDVRSGVVIGPDGNVYFGATDGVLYQLYVSRRLVLIE